MNPAPEELRDLTLRDCEATLRQIEAALTEVDGRRTELEPAAVERLHRLRDMLTDVSATTEVAAVAMRGGLDRALALLVNLRHGSADETGHRAAARLREELLRMADRLRSHADSAERLGRASGMLLDIEASVQRLAGGARPWRDGGDDSLE